MHNKKIKSVPFTAFQSLAYILLMTASLPNEVNAKVDVINSYPAVGFCPRLGDMGFKEVNYAEPPKSHRGHQTSFSTWSVGETLHISNGEDAYPKEYTHQASLVINTTEGFYQLCGAVIISPYHALTAAHCLPYMTGQIYQTYDHFLILGMLDLSLGLRSPGVQVVAVSDYLIHKGYDENRDGFPHDIAMLYLDGPVNSTDYVQFAELAHPSMGTFSETTCLVSGFGETDSGGNDVLQWGYQYIPTSRDCKDFWAISRTAKITKRHICGYYYPIQICSGDSGGPLMCDGVVAGIASWSLGNCSGCFPSIYTRITAYYWWIRKAMLF